MIEGSTPDVTRRNVKRRRCSVTLDNRPKLLASPPSKKRVTDKAPSERFKLPPDSKLAFVGRAEESRRLAALLLENSVESLRKHSEQKKKPKLIVLSQMNGVGKSSLARNFRHVLSNEENNNGWSTFAFQSPNEEQILTNLQNAILVKVEFSRMTLVVESLKSEDRLTFSTVFLKLIEDALITSGINQSVITTVKREISSEDTNISPFTFIQHWNNNKGTPPLLLVLDDIQKLEKLDHYKLVDIDPITATDALESNNQRMERYYIKLWEPLFGCLQLQKVFIFSIAKSFLSVLIGRKLANVESPSECIHIPLKGLNKCELEYCFQQTLDANTNFLKFVQVRWGLKDELRDYFFMKLHYETGGVGRLVEWVFEALKEGPVTERDVMTTKEAIDRMFDNIYNGYPDSTYAVSTKYEVHPLLHTPTDELKQIFLKIYMLASLGLHIEKDILFKYSSQSLSITELMTFVSAMFVPGNNGYDLQVPGFQHRKLQEQIASFDPQFLPDMTFLYHLNQLQSIILDKGMLLETLFLNVLFMMLVHQIHNQKSRGSWNSVWSGLNIFSADSEEGYMQNKQVHFSSSISLLPKMVKEKGKLDSRKKSELCQNPWSHSVNIESWEFVRTQLWKLHTFGLPFPKSHGFDIGCKVDHNQYLAIALKNYAVDTKFTWSDLKEEIKKIQYTTAGDDEAILTLLVISTSYGAEIQNVLNKDKGRSYVPCGRFVYRNKELVAAEAHEDPTIVVPQNMEVIIIGPYVFQEMIGKRNFQVLQDVSHKSDIFDTLFNWAFDVTPSSKSNTSQLVNEKPSVVIKIRKHGEESGGIKTVVPGSMNELRQMIAEELYKGKVNPDNISLVDHQDFQVNLSVLQNDDLYYSKIYE